MNAHHVPGTVLYMNYLIWPSQKPCEVDYSNFTNEESES